MSKLIRIDEDCEEILRKYSTGSMTDCIHAMEAKVMASTQSLGETAIEAAIEVSVEAAVEKAVSRMMAKYEKGQQVVNAEVVSRLSSMGVSAPEGASPDSYGFRRASIREEK